MKSLTSYVNEDLVGSNMVPGYLEQDLESYKSIHEFNAIALNIEELLVKTYHENYIPAYPDPDWKADGVGGIGEIGGDEGFQYTIPKNSYAVIFFRDRHGYGSKRCTHINIYNPSRKRVYFAGFSNHGYEERDIFGTKYYPASEYHCVHTPGRNAVLIKSQKGKKFIDDLCKLLDNLDTAGGRNVTFSSLYEE